MSERNVLISCVTAVVLAAASSPACLADAAVKVSLQDKGGILDVSNPTGLGMGMNGDMKKAVTSIKINQKSVPAGKVTFEVTNLSKETVHEMIVAPIADVNAKLPYVESDNRVDEESAGHLGEVSELDPGKSGALTLEMKPGLYVLYCNIPGHFMSGMWTTLKVK
jgi:uncharacterized cupredoxin-like copper-binding protein